MKRESRKHVSEENSTNFKFSHQIQALKSRANVTKLQWRRVITTHANAQHSRLDNVQLGQSKSEAYTSGYDASMYDGGSFFFGVALKEGRWVTLPIFDVKR